MPRLVFVLALGWCVGTAPLLRAGVYNLAEEPLGPLPRKESVPALPFPLFKNQLTDLVSLGFPLETPLRKRYQERRTELETKHKAGQATIEDQINLSAYLIYLRDYLAAVELLTPLAARERSNFLVNANLMTAYQLSGQLDRAFSMLDQMRGGRPPLPQASPEQLDWYARVEPFHQKLINLRYRESLRQRGGPRQPPETVDDLFGVRFVGNSGQYEAGQLAAEQKAKLPPDAVAIVQQLLIWLPDDTRLYWLLGELYNAQGDLARAAAVFDDCRRESSRRLDAAELRAHRQIVQEALAKAPPLDMVQEGVATVADQPSTSDAPATWLPDKQHLVIVGGLAGLAVAVLAYFQVREFRRRRQGKPTGC